MRVVPTRPDELSAQGFTQSNDLFQKGDLARRLTATFLGLEHGTVCLIDGRWGVGKTVFAKQWVADLRAAKIPAIYFDAFESDYLENPFQALASAFVESAAAVGRTNDPRYRRFLSSAASVGKVVASTSAKLGIKIASAGLIGAAELDQIKETGDDIAEALGDLAEKQIEKILEQHAQSKAKFSALRDSLSKIRNLLQIDQSGDEKPLLVIIDELDRCRPDFALGMLETLKHFFRVDGIHFILISNMPQLEASVTARYGSLCDSSEYLQKFYDFYVIFDQEYDKHTHHGIRSFINDNLSQLLKSHEFNEIADHVLAISMAFRLTLREIQSFCVNVAIAYLAAQDREFRPAILISMLTFFKTKNPALYKKAKLGSISGEMVHKFLAQGRWESYNIDRVVEIFTYYTLEKINENEERWQNLRSMTWNYDLERRRVIPYLVNSVIERFGAPAR